MEIPLKTKSKATIGSSNPIPGYISRKDKNSNLKRYVDPMFIAALFTIAKTWGKKTVTHQQRIGLRRRGISIMEYYSAIKKNEIIAFAAT